MADYFITSALFARVRTMAWDEVMKAPAPASALLVATVIDHYGRALALLAKGDRHGADRERALFELAAGKVPADGIWSQNKAGDIVKVAREVLTARFGENAMEHWNKAIAMQDALVYDEPPGWYYPIRESLGAELLKAGRAAEAEGVLREGLRRSPRDGFMLFLLMEALKGQTKESLEVRREFEAIWGKSDVRLSVGAW
jgi:hypothetical protein